ncbi:hypothetical protein [Fimbriiglobus ruber]|uniref:Uncharacterized protein n=1 Tax=Fimbriiglobus ruber TaxID=1908690 RepID=A0A225DCJ1_9BACT|nr:hypothetical protein [Fimbriiglobus ruber]OWK34105.1 hypothetical protein FRUB_10076 [Fimbriiglobus ruber]
MTGVLRTQLTTLAATIADLKERVRVAVAGELARAVSAAVQQVVQAVAAGRTTEPVSESRRRPADRWADDEDDWDRTRDPWADDRGRMSRESAARGEDRPTDPRGIGLTTAVAAGIFVARWWLLRRGTLLAAAGLGLGVGLLGVVGGPAARTAVAVLAAAADVLGATDALGAGAAHLEDG